MILYRYKAQSLEGKIHIGKYWCNDEYDLIRNLREKGLYLLSYSNREKSFVKVKIPAKQLSYLCRYFNYLLCAGINIVDVVRIAESRMANKLIKKSLKEIGEMLQRGIEISDCMKLYPNVYPEFMLSMIKVGEESGRLDQIFDKLSYIYENESKLKNKITKASIYPCILFIVSGLIIQFMALYVMPKFMPILDNLNGDMPPLSKVIFSLGSFIRSNYATLAFVVCATVLAFIFSLKPGIRRKFIIIPIISRTFLSKIVININAIKFSRCLGILLGSGVHILKALDITEQVLKDSFIKDKISSSIQQIKNGNDISKSLSTVSGFPDMFYEMVRIGEETGTLDSVLVKAADIMEEELYSFIDKLTVLIEPIMIIVISIIIGVILIAFMLPVMNIYDAI
jgi:type IV pilus assembly protein PilC